MKYILGTAQFGLDYGVSNGTGRVSDENLFDILQLAYSGGFEYLDTANVYGDAESRVGDNFHLTKNFELITKTAHLNRQSSIEENVNLVNVEFKKSLVKMKRSFADTVLVHNCSDLLCASGDRLYETLCDLKSDRLVKRIGVSVYTPYEAKEISSRYNVDVIQFPINVFDQNFESSGVLNFLKSRDIELHARSIFLQGLLLLESDEFPDYFESIDSIFKDYFDFLKTNNLNRIEGAVNYVKQICEIDALVFGVQNSAQLHQIIQILELPKVGLDYSNFAVRDSKYINPSLWRFK
jgi:aryl-alcohol dehydrogenase-like predicted oxidoreductase